MSTELYLDDLHALEELMNYLADISGVSGVYQAELRVKFDDANVWAVIGWGESGDPCLLRFDRDPEPVKITFPNQVQPFTINKAAAIDPPLKDYDQRF